MEIIPGSAISSEIRKSLAGLAGGDLSKGLSLAEMKTLQDTQTEGPKSFFIDPQVAFDLVGYMRRQKPLTASLLREVAYRDKIILAIVKLRKNQIRNFARRYHPRRSESGWKICLADVDRSPTPSDKKRMDELAYFIENMGFTDTKFSGAQRDRFPQFIDKMVEDSLVLDSACFEKVYDMAGNLAEVYPVDGGTIRIVHRDVENVDTSIKYCQEWQGQILAYFTDSELAYCVRNPRTDIRTMGYGMSEVEQLVETVTSHLFSEQWNARFFNQGAIPQGVLSITGNVSQETLEAFKRNWLIQVSGVTNAWRVPVIGVPEGKGVNWIPFHSTQRDMEFYQWMRYLIASICAVFQCDPMEIGFEGFRGPSDRSIFEARGEFKITASQDKGLYPLMQWLGDTINEEIVKLIYPDLRFVWVGLRDKSEREALEMQQMEINMGKLTVNEIRAQEDLPKIDEDWANAPGNPTLANIFMAKYQNMVQQEMMEQQQAAAAAAPPPPGPEGMPPEGAPAEGAPPEGGQPAPSEADVNSFMGSFNQNVAGAGGGA